jgi:5-methylcytosine-specific restriction endonuclease McrA
MPTLKPNGQRLNGKGSHWINDVVRLAIYLRDHLTCQYCGRDLHEANPREVTLDHLRPQCNGGDHKPSNLITACLSCNSRRQHQPWRQYAPAGAVERILRNRRRTLPMKLARAIKRGEISRAQARLELM